MMVITTKLMIMVRQL